MSDKTKIKRRREVRLVVCVDERERNLLWRWAERRNLPTTTAMRNALLGMAEAEQAKEQTA
jgi:hypothetical protein